MNKHSTLCVPVAKCTFVKTDVAWNELKQQKQKPQLPIDSVKNQRSLGWFYGI
jgi:hypothetical protein